MFISIFFLLILSDIVLPNSVQLEYEFDLAHLLGIGEQYHHPLRRLPSLKSSALKYLLEVYNENTENKDNLEHVREYLVKGWRQKRELREENFITEFDHINADKCNTIITFLSKNVSNRTTSFIPDIPIYSDMIMGFNINGVPRDLQLVHAALRIYQQPSLGKYAQNSDIQNVTISIYEKEICREDHTENFKVLHSINTTTINKGWIEFNMTQTLYHWLKKTPYGSSQINEIIVGLVINDPNKIETVEILASDLGIVRTEMSNELIELHPFIVGHFNGPELLTKLQKAQFKLDAMKHKRKVHYSTPKPKQHIQEIYKMPESCERFNFTFEFKDLKMQEWIIAPRKFEAYFCAGKCNFPLSSKMNASNHAIVQTLVHLMQGKAPRPSCVPTALSSITILNYINDDSVNLSTYHQSVAKECGCH